MFLRIFERKKTYPILQRIIESHDDWDGNCPGGGFATVKPSEIEHLKRRYKVLKMHSSWKKYITVDQFCLENILRVASVFLKILKSHIKVLLKI